MLEATQRYYLVGGKGGVGKTSMAASLAVKFANQGEPTPIVSMDPTRSLGDSFEQDMSDGKARRVDGFDSLFATERDPKTFHSQPESSQGIGCVKKEWGHPEVLLVNDLLERMGLGTYASMLNEILSRVPPGLEEAYALSQLIKSIEQEETNKFRRIVLDAPSNGHTLKLLSANSWIEKTILMAIKCGWLEEQRQKFARAQELLSDPRSTEFIVVTIPTMMAVSDSSRFHASLKKDGVHTRRLIVNQVLPPSTSDCRFCAAKRREQARAFGAIREDRELGGLKLIQAPLLDVEAKGVPALRFLSDSVWK